MGSPALSAGELRPCPSPRLALLLTPMVLLYQLSQLMWLLPVLNILLLLLQHKKACLIFCTEYFCATSSFKGRGDNIIFPLFMFQLFFVCFFFFVTTLK